MLAVQSASCARWCHLLFEKNDSDWPLKLEVECVGSVAHQPLPKRGTADRDLCFAHQADSQEVVRVIFRQRHFNVVDRAEWPGLATRVHLCRQVAAVEAG